MYMVHGLTSIFTMKIASCLIILLIGLQNTAIAQEKKTWRLKLGVLPTYDYTWQTSTETGVSSWVTHFTPHYSAFEIRAEQTHRKNQKMGIGIRHKRHWVTVKTDQSVRSTLGEVTNSIHLYYGLHWSFDGHSWFNRFDIGASLGGLVDFAEPSLFAPGNDSIAFNIGATSYYSVSHFPRKGENYDRVLVSGSFDINGDISYRITPRIHVFVGLGFNLGTRTLVQGRYSFGRRTLPGDWERETTQITYQGIYRYGIMGVRYDIKPRGALSHIKKL